MVVVYQQPFTLRKCEKMIPRMTEKKQIVFAKLFLVLVISVVVIPLGFVLLVLPYYSALAYSGQDVLLSLDSAEYMPLKKVKGNQVEMFVKYMVNDSSIIDKQINCVMKVYYPNSIRIKDLHPSR